MRRTSDQVKLLVFGLLRTVSALATTEHKIFPYAAQAVAGHGGSNMGVTLPEITLRLARRSDVPGIQRCNLATLPENYNQQFYSNHLRQWPELVLVAESSEPLKREDQPIYSPFPSSGPESNVVAYVIGKIEEVTEMSPDQPDYSTKHRAPPAFRTEKLGHVTSLAVLDGFRRRGLAQALMQQLHHHMESCYDVKSVGLHVRVSNAPAARLYNSFGYVVAEVIPAYYQDGEDAYLMKKWLEPQRDSPQPHHHMSLFGSLRRSRPWESGPRELRLPRLVERPRCPEQQQQQQPQNGSASPEIMTEAS